MLVQRQQLRRAHFVSPRRPTAPPKRKISRGPSKYQHMGFGGFTKNGLLSTSSLASPSTKTGEKQHEGCWLQTVNERFGYVLNDKSVSYKQDNRRRGQPATCCRKRILNSTSTKYHTCCGANNVPYCCQRLGNSSHLNFATSSLRSESSSCSPPPFSKSKRVSCMSTCQSQRHRKSGETQVA